MYPLLPELVDNVVAHLEDNDMQAFALTCRSNNEIARKRMLWTAKDDLRSTIELMVMIARSREEPLSTLQHPSSFRNLSFPIDFPLDLGHNWCDETDVVKAETRINVLGLVLEYCTNLHSVEIPFRGPKLSHNAQSSVVDTLGGLTNLRYLDLSNLCLDVPVFEAAVDTLFGRLRSLVVKVVGKPDDSITLAPCSITRLDLTVQDLKDDIYHEISRSMFPACRSLQLSVLGNQTTVEAVTQSLTFINHNILLHATVTQSLLSEDDTVMSPPYLNQGPLSAVFMLARDESTTTDQQRKVTRWMRLGSWHELQRRKMVYEMACRAMDDVWVRKGDDMGDEGKRLVLDEAQKWGKKIVWF